MEFTALRGGCLDSFLLLNVHDELENKVLLVIFDYSSPTACICQHVTASSELELRSNLVPICLDIMADSSVQDWKLKYVTSVKDGFQHIMENNLSSRKIVGLERQYPRLRAIQVKSEDHSLPYSGSLLEQAEVNTSSDKYSPSTIQALYVPDDHGFVPKTVVVQGPAGIGKTVTSQKMMLDWASGKLYGDKFNFVFYMSCREINRITGNINLAGLLAKTCNMQFSDDLVKAIFQDPAKVLLIIDGFDELRWSLEDNYEEYQDPFQETHKEILLRSIFRKEVLNATSLMITTRAFSLEKLKDYVEPPCSVEILGFTGRDLEDYISNFFKNKEVADKALAGIKGNEALLTMCSVPLMCWIVCTILKQGVKHDILAHCKTATSIYLLYLKNSIKYDVGKQLINTCIKKLCALANDGILNQKLWFEEGDLARYGLALSEVESVFLNQNIFHWDTETSIYYSFSHLSVQEFFAALYYVLGEEAENREGHPEVCKGNSLSEQSAHHSHLTQTVRFLCGLLNDQQLKEFASSVGCDVTLRAKPALEKWISGGKPSRFCNDALHCIYEMQDEAFRDRVLHQEDLLFSPCLYFGVMENICTRELIYCLADAKDYCSISLEDYLLRPRDLEILSPLFHRSSKLSFTRCGFPEDAEKGGYVSWLLNPNSKIQELELQVCVVTPAFFKDLHSFISTNRTINKLLIGYHKLADSTLKLVCDGLRHPGCTVQKLTLRDCDLTSSSCEELGSAIKTNHSLRKLDMALNKLQDDGVKFLCEGLKDPGCTLQELRGLNWRFFWFSSERAVGMTAPAGHVPDKSASLKFSKTAGGRAHLEIVYLTCQDENRNSRGAWAAEQFKQFFSWMVKATQEYQAPEQRTIRDRIPIAEDMEEVRPGPSSETFSSAQEWESDSEDEVKEDPRMFNLDTVNIILKHINKSLGIEEPTVPIKPQDALFSEHQVKSRVLHTHKVVKDLIAKECQALDKSHPNMGKLNCMYPFHDQDVQKWCSVPKVDSAIDGLSTKSTLSWNDGGPLKDAMDRRMETSFRKLHISSGITLKSGIAMASVARALRLWASTLHTDIEDKINRLYILKSLEVMQKSIDFLCEASLDTILFSSRSMPTVVVARRALWLRPWAADHQSISRLTTLPYEGNFLYGEKLDNLMQRLASSNANRLPQDRKVRRFHSYSPKQQFKEAYTQENKEKKCGGDSGPPDMAEASLVRCSTENVAGTSMAITGQARPHTSESSFTSKSKLPEFDGVERDMAKDPMSARVPDVLEFLKDGFVKGLAPATLKVQVSALSILLDIKLASQGLIFQFFQALKRLHPRRKPFLAPLMSYSDLTPTCCEYLGSVLLVNRSLTTLFMSDNDLQDSGAKLLCEGLRQPDSTLKEFRIHESNLTSACCEDFRSVLLANRSLTTLDLTYNNLQDTGIKVLCEGLQDPGCTLKELVLSHCDLTSSSCDDICSVITTNRSLVKLDLTWNSLQDSVVKPLCEALKDPTCVLRDLRLYGCDLTSSSCDDLCSLITTTRSLASLDLAGNQFQDPGVKLLCEALRNPSCHLQVVRVGYGDLTNTSCDEILAVVNANKSLTELDITMNVDEEQPCADVDALCKRLERPACTVEKSVTQDGTFVYFTYKKNRTDGGSLTVA
ncbi:uncharacterized protein LOC142095507 [Mixophyes fleayi]|uniref:uncharacterized protein LOC142095507 n=1 Tax=Mixophyes fleayi TaxID=3061075 RepID=UPI003F4E40BF